MIITEQMVEAAAIALFEDDEDRNDEWIAKLNAEGRGHEVDPIRYEREAWSDYADGRNGLQEAFRRRARAALGAAAKVADTRNEVRGDGGCLYCDADQGENHRPDCTRPGVSHG
jgi:hypothetical protein